MKNTAATDVLAIQKFSKDLNGVFKGSDLHILLQSNNLATLHNRIDRLIRSGVLRRFCKGIYTVDGFSVEVLSGTIDPEAYISLGTVLAKHALIGTVPDRRLIAVRPGRNRRYAREDLTIDHFSISKELYFGFTQQNGIRMADPEKAFIDTLYYHMKGRRFSFNPAVDIDVAHLNARRVKKYLSKYRNGRFVRFCEAVLNG